MHRYDRGAYSVILFDRMDRKRRSTPLAKNFLRGQLYAKRWARRTGGSAVLMHCVHNTKQEAWSR